MQKFIIKIDEQHDGTSLPDDAECFLLSENLPTETIKKLANLAHRTGRLVLTTSPRLCMENGLDGVILDFSKSEDIPSDYRAQTKDLKGKFIGAICRNRRHEAMILSECEPDFIVFRAWTAGVEKVLELTDWYNEFFLIQSAVLPMDSEMDTSAFKTDFVIVESALQP